MKIFLLAAISLFESLSIASGEGTEGPPRIDVEKITAQVRPSLVTLISISREGTAHGIGTGFVISKNGLVATNLHVVGEARPIRVELQDGTRPEVTEVVAWSREDDLLIFRMKIEDLPPLRLAPAEPPLKQGAGIVAMGNPLGLRYSVVEGVLSERREVDGKTFLQLAMPVEPGNSGGPVVDASGAVHGVINMKNTLRDAIGYAIPVERLQRLLNAPRPVPMKNWLTIGALNRRLWEIGEAEWVQHAGVITARGTGTGFGGRVLCTHRTAPPALPYEVAVQVRFSDASGAAGIAFCQDGPDTHYGFYPTAGKMRLTRFQGPDVGSWNILEEVTTEAYRPEEWNRLRVRLEEERILCYVNEVLVITSTDTALRRGAAGLCKFRRTEPEFKNFILGADLSENSEAGQKFLTNEFSQWLAGKQAGKQMVEKLLPQPQSLAWLGQAQKRLQEQQKELAALTSALHSQQVALQMKALLPADESLLDLGKAALLIAKLDLPDLPVDAYVEELDRLAAEAKPLLDAAAAKEPQKRLERLLEWLFKESGFHGSRDEYQAKPNSYLSAVLDDREGIPVTLSVLVMELARRLELPVCGIPLPGHFVIQLQVPGHPEGGPYYDVFDGGIRFDRSQAAERLQRGAAFSEDDFRPASKPEILVRMLRNLTNNQLDKDATKALPYVNLILTLRPDSATDRLSRAILLYQSNQKAEALHDIHWLLEKRPENMDLERLEEWKAELEH